ncbi:hypothetical protein [Herbaspirillum sp. alder98]|uniref:hypothetical protein n=1 Tax=Herbaspirillum sp. alder98 TaxID=2913096 RepID=UPI001CD82C81|nr:hypothetical protein [Herbaspirillum sp. alder98]MCA1322881.1 hypothetical protein [Herbaspirillum sp. alder98]
MKYSYQAEKFFVARSALMLPHTRGEAESVAEAFHECSLGMHRFSEDGLDENARTWLAKLSEFMDTSSVNDTSGRGAWVVKAEKFSTDDLIQISTLIDELATWFDHAER